MSSVLTSALPLSDRVTHWETHRGRNSEFDRTEAGTGTIVLRNRDGLFDPLNAYSPYVASNNLLPIRQVTITCNKPDTPDVYKPVFTGFIESWEFERRGPRDAMATLGIVDGFELLQNAQVQPMKGTQNGGHYFAVQHVDDRIRAALGFAKWPAIRTSIFSGNVWCQPYTYSVGSSMLEVIQDAADAEFPGVANFFMDTYGRAAFRGRLARLDPFNPAWNTARSRVSRLFRFGDDGACEADPSLLPMANLKWTYSKELLYTSVTVVPQGMVDETKPRIDLQTFKDTAAMERYGKRDLTISGLMTYQAYYDGTYKTAAVECRNFAKFILNNHKVPRPRATELEVHSHFEDDRIWDFLINVELNDIVELYTVQPGGGGFTGEQFYIDGIHNVVDAEGDWPAWVSTYDLTSRAYWPNAWPDPDSESSVFMAADSTDPHAKTPMEFPVHVQGYSDAAVLAAAITYCGTLYPDRKWPHMLMQEGHIEPGNKVWVKYFNYAADAVTYTGSSTELTPL